MNRRRPLVALLAGAVAFAPVPAVGSLGRALSEGAPTQSEAPTVRLVIDTSRMVEDERADTAKWIRDDGTRVLADAGVKVDDDAELEVRVVVMAEGVSYAVETSVWKPGADEPKVHRGHRVCEACVRSEVLRLVNRELAWVGGWLAVRPAPAEPEAEASPVQTDEPERDPVAAEPSRAVEPEVDREPPKRPTKALRNAGLALVVPGGVALGVGIGMIAAGKRKVENPDDGDAVVAERNYRPAGIVLAVGGGVAAAAGVALLVVHARRSRAGRTARVAWAPVVDETHVGAVLAGRF